MNLDTTKTHQSHECIQARQFRMLVMDLDEILSVDIYGSSEGVGFNVPINILQVI